MTSSGNSTVKILVAAGGTGGHIFPAIAVLEVLSERHPELEIKWLGSSHRMESKLIPDRGIDFIGLRQTEIRRKLTLGNIFYNVRTLWFLARSIFQSVGIIRKHKPSIVLSTGGFAAGAAGIAAGLTGTPLAIVEPNAYPGLTNRWLGKHASAVFTAYPEASKHFPESVVHATGAPARREVISASRDDARMSLGINDDILMVLAMGGSQGASINNNNLPDAISSLIEKNIDLKIFVVHQCGMGKSGAVKINRNTLPEKMYKVVEFIEDTPTYLAASDLIISRAGASTLSEICCRGLPSILIPLSTSAENHQVVNARAWESKGAAFCIEEKELSPEILAEKIGLLLTDPNLRKKMGTAASESGDPSAAERIADHLEGIIYPNRAP